MPLTRFGLLTTNYSYDVPPDRLFDHYVEVAEAVESTAFDTLWLPDHLVQGAVGDIAANRREVDRTTEGPKGRTSPIFDAPTLLCALAVTTKRLRIGPLVSPVTFRHPAVLAKIMTTVDVVSGGRAVLGLGSAWDADEHRRYGFAYPPFRERTDRLEDAVQICRAMFDKVAASYSGTYYSIDEAINMPRPLNGHVPILIGGAGRRTVQIAATHADACNPIGDQTVLRRAFATLDEHLHEIGRDPAEVARPAGVLFHRLEDLFPQVEQAFAAGCDGVLLVPWQQALSPDEITRIGDRLASEFGGTM
jgi:alkanesulfonate monooxygenase SsuD/methylene tetrahydromethanopterin reductase-like flavin-dependent oxidoreductase (luciferase family)